MSMKKFRKKPIVVEARQWFVNDGDVIDGVFWSMAEKRYCVITAHGQSAYLDDGDWIIAESMPGRFYPCKPDIFAATYEPVEE